MHRSSRVLVRLAASLSLLLGISAPAAQAQMQPMPMNGALNGGNCGFDQPAFCDTFDQPFGGNPYGIGGRTGALDPARWSVARVSQYTNPGQGVNDEFQPTRAMFCKTPITGLAPDRDYFMCDADGMESMHFMEAINDEGMYVFNSARILQPFDFANRTGTVAFDVDAKTAGEHSWWVEVWLTEDPLPAPHHTSAAGHLAPDNGLGIMFSNDLHRHGEYMQPQYVIVNGKAMTDNNGLHITGGVSTMDDMKNHFELRVSQQRLEIWGSDPMGDNFHQLAYVDPLNLSFTRGYVHLEHSQYAAKKTGPGITNQQTYHWDNVGFDGPVLPTPRTYSVPDSLAPAPKSDPPGAVSLGYALDSNRSHSFTLDNVDPSGATGAVLGLDVWFAGKAPTLQYRLNGGDWQSVRNYSNPTGFEWHDLVAPVPVSELVAGTNTLELMSDAQASVANIDLTVGPGGAPVEPPMPMPADNQQPAAPANTQQPAMPGDMNMPMPGDGQQPTPPDDMNQAMPMPSEAEQAMPDQMN